MSEVVSSQSDAVGRRARRLSEMKTGEFGLPADSLQRFQIGLDEAVLVITA